MSYNLLKNMRNIPCKAGRRRFPVQKTMKGLMLCVCCLSMVACQWKIGEERNGENEVKVCRFDKLLNEYVSMESFSALQKMNTEYPQETKILMEDVLNIGKVDDERINSRLRAYYADSTIRTLMGDALEKYEDMKSIEHRLTKGFRKLKEEIPMLKVPRVYAQISALNQSVVVGDGILGFSIDKYMGTDYPIYKKYYYDYQCRTMEPSRIVPDCFMYYLISEYPFPWEWNRSLLDHIMHYGKVHWVIAQILDYDSLEEEIGYTKAEAEWCGKNKQGIWNYVMQNRHLEAKDPMLLRMYMRPAPCTVCFGEDSPYELGVWIGAKLIDAYMKKNKEVTIAQLLEDTDYRKMLADIHYKL